MALFIRNERKVKLLSLFTNTKKSILLTDRFRDGHTRVVGEHGAFGLCLSLRCDMHHIVGVGEKSRKLLAGHVRVLVDSHAERVQTLVGLGVVPLDHGQVAHKDALSTQRKKKRMQAI
jgi:hypothetical protein